MKYKESRGHERNQHAMKGNQYTMKGIKTALSTATAVVLICVFWAAPSAGTTLTALQIMEKADQVARTAYATEVAAVKLTTCKYKIVSGAVKCADKPRVVVADNAKKGKLENGLFSVRSLLVLREPISEKGTGLLVYEYGERGRDNDNWLYLPALGKTNRVIASDDSAGSVFGSEFSVESTQNPEARKIDEFTYRVIEETNFQKRPAWVVEMIPTAEKAKKTSYQKIVVWVDKATYLTLKEDYYRAGRLHKQRMQSGIRSIDGHYGVTKVTVNNLGSSRISQMHKFQIRRNIEIADDYLTQRALTDFAFRERNLTRFRTELGKSKDE